MKKRKTPAADSGTAGMTLVEVMISAFVLAVGLVGLMCAICSSMVVDNVAQENNVVLDIARQLMEHVKEENFLDLAKRVDTTQHEVGVVDSSAFTTADPATLALTTSSPDDFRYSREFYEGDYYNQEYGGINYVYTPDTYQGINVQANWFESDIEVDNNNNPIYFRNINVDAAGNFHIPGLEPVPGDWDGQVGRINVDRVSSDLLEVTISIRWIGKRGRSHKVLRCMVADWGYY